jgi:hypothetical protein
VQARDWLSRKRNPVQPPVSPVPAKPIFKEGMLEGRLDPHVQFQSPMETRSYWVKPISQIPRIPRRHLMCLLQERVSSPFSNYWLLSNLSVFLYLCEAGSRMEPFHVISFCGLAVHRVVFGAAACAEDDRAGCTTSTQTRCFVFHLGLQNLALSNFQLLKQSALALSVATS